jgi:hypothetical protein
MSSGVVPADSWVYPEGGGGGENPIPNAVGGSEREGEHQTTSVWRRACMTRTSFAVCLVGIAREMACQARSEAASSRLQRQVNMCAASGGLPTYSVVHRPSDSLIRCDSQTIIFACIRSQEF